VDGWDDGVVELVVELGGDGVLEFDFVEDFPVFDRVGVTGVVVDAAFVCEAAFYVPGNQTRVVVRYFFQG